MSSEFIIDVNEAEFQNEVLAYSAQVPVIVEFWAEWCIPCRTLGPILEKLAEEAQGTFRLARLNVDENPRLAKHYVIGSIPAVKVFQAGQVSSEFTGLKTEPEVREYMLSLTPSANDLAVEKGNSLYLGRQWEGAADAFRECLQANPDRGEALLGLAKVELAMGNQSTALAILSEFPASKQYSIAEKLKPLANAISRVNIDDEVEDQEPLESAYTHSLNLVGRGNFPAAIDGLLDIAREDKNYQNGEARQALLGALEMLDQDGDEVRDYRQELASILF